jgi:PLP dependent protein
LPLLNPAKSHPVTSDERQISIAERLAQVHARIRAAAQACGRDPAGIRLIAVSKTKPAQAVEAAFAAGHTAFGENYVQEGCGKIIALAALRNSINPVSNTASDAATNAGSNVITPTEAPRIEWHCIGPLQSNKTALVATHFDWVQSVDRLKIAERLSAQRPAELAPLNVLVQVNVSGEASKGGVAPGEALALCAQVANLPNLRLRGLMAIPEPLAAGDTASLTSQFAEMRALSAQLIRIQPAGNALSMGMSSDLELAIVHGATMVRIGTAIFGERDYAP